MKIHLIFSIYCLLWTLAVNAKSLLETIESDDRFSILVEHLKRTDLARDLDKNFKTASIFAPINEAFEKRKEDEWTYTLFGHKVSRAQLLYHILPNAVKTSELHDGELFETRYERGMKNPQMLKVTKHNKDWVVGSESKIIDGDIEADNGIIHAIDHLLYAPVDLERTISQRKDNDDDNFAQFAWLVEKAQLTDELKRADGYTVFITKDVLEGLDDVEKAYLNHSLAKDDLVKILKHQMLGQTVYSRDIPSGKTKFTSLEGEDLNVVVDKKDQVFINDVKIVKSDILASNGVIHVLEHSILPKNRDFLKLDVRKILIGMNATKFVSLCEEYGLESYLLDQDSDDNKKALSHTVLAPPDAALDEDEIPHKQIKPWLQYHFIRDKFTPDDLKDGSLLETESNNRLGTNARQSIRVHVTDQDQRVWTNYPHAKGGKKSIQFDRASMIRDPVSVGKSIVYPVSRPVMLPRDPLARLPLDLDLSTFVATLYASGAAGDVQDAEGITLFAPTNRAFARLGILTKHLLQPNSQDKLANVIKFHAVQDLYYVNTTSEGEHRAPTLAGPEININKTKDGELFLRGTGAADGSDRSVIGRVIGGRKSSKDILVSNGVLHKIDRVQLPNNVKVTNRDLLTAENTNTLLNLIERTNLTRDILDSLDIKQKYTVLAPNDRAFAKLNVSQLLNEPKQLLRIAKLHVLPVALPRMSVEAPMTMDEENDDKKENQPSEISKDGTEFESLLDKDTKVVITKVDNGYTVQVKGDNTKADVINLGRASHGGGVIEIDRVLLPLDQTGGGGGGLAWWQVILIVAAVLLGAAVLAAAVYYGWRWWKQRREGYISLDQ